MVKPIYQVDSSAVSTKDLTGAAKKFLVHCHPDRDLIVADNIDSPKFGSSDLLFTDKAKSNLIVVRLNSDEDSCERFIVSSISYYLWLKEAMAVSEVFLNAKSRLDMYLFSHGFSPSISHMMDYLSKKIRVQLVRYDILQIEDQSESTIYFQQLTPRDIAEDKPVEEIRQREHGVFPKEKKAWSSPKISAEELKEFNRLKQLHLG